MAESTAPITSSPRVVALDNLRVVAMLLGLVTHGVLPYTATGVAQFPIRDHSRHIAADACVLRGPRLPHAAVLPAGGVRGHGTGLAPRRRWAGAQPPCAVALPLALAVFVVCPAMHILFAHHTASRGLSWHVADSGGWIGPNFHLWFLYYLLMCCVPLAIVLARRDATFRVESSAQAMPRRAGSSAGGGRSPSSPPLAVPVLWDMPAWWIDTPRGWLPDLTIYVYYLGFFLAGALLYRHRDLLARHRATLARFNSRSRICSCCR